MAWLSWLPSHPTLHSTLVFALPAAAHSCRAVCCVAAVLGTAGPCYSVSPCCVLRVPLLTADCTLGTGQLRWADSGPHCPLPGWCSVLAQPRLTRTLLPLITPAPSSAPPPSPPSTALSQPPIRLLTSKPLWGSKRSIIFPPSELWFSFLPDKVLMR